MNESLNSTREPREDPEVPGGGASHRSSDPDPKSWWYGRSGLLLALIMAAFSTYLVIGIAMMQVPEGTEGPGPGFFPLIIAIIGYVVAVLLFVSYVRTREPALPATFSEQDDVSDEERAEADAAARVKYASFSDWVSLAWAIGGFAAFALLLIPLGWVLAGALLFWCVARSMGSVTPVRDVVVALTVSSLAYLAFGVALGLNLPSGILGGAF